MVKPATLRKKKYETGIDPELTKKKIESIRDVMVELESPYLAEITEIERKTKQICESQGIPTIQVAQYINFARKMYSLSKKFSEATLAAEAQYLVNLWVSRGLLGAKLVEIAQLYGVTPTAPPPPIYEVSWSVLHRLEPNSWHYSLLKTAFSPISYVNVPANRLRATAFPLPRKTSWNAIGLRVIGAGAVGALVRLGIYADNGSVYPGSLMADYGTVDASVIGHKELPIVPDLELEHGLYWLVCNTNDGTIDLPYQRGGNMVIGNANTLGTYAHTYHVAQAFGALPANFPVGAAKDYKDFLLALKLVALL